ncbi:hypothetical protein [Larkinella sp. C7]|jgi:hypothetical protein|uniref:hypothetical protein n=1 Tax=Larkinella sp. C7 TaxID=2576607 RepID=UPI0011110F48|nr:hypothetical protein [Larkinella sp. C7]
MKLKSLFFGVAGLVLAVTAQAQVKIGNNPTTINAGSILEMETTNKGMLMPRVALSSTTVWGLAGTAAAGMIVYNTADAGSGNTAVVANTLYAWSGTSWERIVKNTDNNDNSSPFVIGEIRTSRMIVPSSTWTSSGSTILVMTGTASNNTGTTTRRAAFPNATNSPNAIIINGLRMDFIRSPIAPATSVSPKLFNTTNSPFAYSISTLSTNDQYTQGANTTIAPNAYSYYVDGNDDLATSSTGSEYVNAMITFSTGEWYNCTWHATTDGLNHFFYVTAQRLN